MIPAFLCNLSDPYYPMSASPVLNVVVRAVRKAGALALRHFDQRDRLRVAYKGEEDLVTNADTEVERELLYHLQKGYPQYGVLAEESGGVGADKEWVWVVDPIDGTTNFVHGFPHFALSVALIQRGEVVLGVVYDPVRDELFAAEKGRGAFLNDRRVRVSETPGLTHALLATGFPFHQKELAEPYFKSFRTFFDQCREVRRAGSAALDLAYVASGRFDGFWEVGLMPWDVAAGELLVREAGGFVTDFGGERWRLGKGPVAAANPKLLAKMLEVIQTSGFNPPEL